MYKRDSLLSLDCARPLSVSLLPLRCLCHMCRPVTIYFYLYSIVIVIADVYSYYCFDVCDTQRVQRIVLQSARTIRSTSDVLWITLPSDCAKVSTRFFRAIDESTLIYLCYEGELCSNFAKNTLLRSC